MAILVFTNAQILIGGVDLSDHGTKVTCIDQRAEVDVSAFGAGYFQYTKGLGTAEIDVELLQDFANSKVHQTIQPLIASVSPIIVEIRPVAAARSTTNPAFLMSTALLFEYKGLDNAIGEMSKITCAFKNGPGGAGMTYPTV